MQQLTLSLSAPQILAFAGSLAVGGASLLAFAVRFAINLGRQMSTLEAQGEATQVSLHNLQVTLTKKVDDLAGRVGEIEKHLAKTVVFPLTSPKPPAQP